MYKTIRELFETSDYDFRTFANPDDPLRNLFDEWVPYYRMKWAIVRALQPKNILEIGVRYGYSTRTFLDASPEASYLGIDLDVITYGGTPGAINWAKHISEGRKAEFLIGNSQDMDRFPGGTYDLIHVDGQQDEDGFFRNGQKALRQGSYILIDSYFWTDATFEATNVLLRQYRALIDFYLVIPGYAGDLLIKTSDGARHAYAKVQNPSSSQDLQDTYTSDYYLTDCGGNEAYRRSGGKSLEDQRLGAMAAFAKLRPKGKFLDLGCGRGELAYAFAAKGATGTAIDYSPDAIKLSEQCFDGEPELRKRVELICGDAITAAWPEKPELATAGDLVEHLTPSELERLYERLSKNMAPDGLFIVHTFPNLWFYKYGYPKRRKAAMASGKYITPEPRSLYEQLMHINEQSPRVLRDQLKRHFAHVIVWLGMPEDPLGSLDERKPLSYFHTARDVFAVASNAPIDLTEIQADLRMQAIPVPAPGSVNIELLQAPISAGAGSRFTVKVSLSNHTNHQFSSLMPKPIYFAYHWLDAATGCEAIEGGRTPLPASVRPGDTVSAEMGIDAPAQQGNYRLRVTLVQEWVAWWNPSLQSCADILIH